MLTLLGKQVQAGLVRPATERDSSLEPLFNIALELIFAYEDATTQAVRDALMRVMHNVGMGVEPATGSDSDPWWYVQRGERSNNRLYLKIARDDH